jgi:hypothetical protein
MKPSSFVWCIRVLTAACLSRVPGEVVEVEARPVTIYHLDLLPGYTLPAFGLEVLQRACTT